MTESLTRIITRCALPVVTAVMATVMATVCGCSSDSRADLFGVGRLDLNIVMPGMLLRPDGTPGDVPVPYEVADEDIDITMISLAGDYAHTWNGFASFPQNEKYFDGEYRLTATAGDPLAEGYDVPAFAGGVTARVVEGTTVSVDLPLSLSVALFTSGGPLPAEAGYAVERLELHTPSGEFRLLDPEAEPGSYLCMRPGHTLIYVTVADGKGESVRLRVAEFETIPAALYAVTADITASGATSPVLDIDWGSGHESIALTDDLFAATAPVITTSWDTVLSVPEGENAPCPVTATVAAGTSTLSHVFLSVTSPSLSAIAGFPVAADLLHLSEAQREAFAALGFRPGVTASGGTIDFSPLFPYLVCSDGCASTTVFTIEGVDEMEIASEPVTLVDVTSPVELQITSVSNAIIGVDRATLAISCDASRFADNITVETADPYTGAFSPTPVSVTSAPGGVYDVAFDVPAGSAPVAVRVYYCGNLREELTIERGQPDYSIDVDAYATTAVVRIVAADPALVPVITTGVNLYIDGKESPLYERYPDKGYIVVIGLNPSSTYTFKATMMSASAPSPVFTDPVRVRTEATAQLPNPDFEDRTDGVNYKNLQAGGRFSQTTVEIVNLCHHVSYAQEVPKGWANTNAKTFCTRAANHNSWYMQPSVALTRGDVFSGDYAVTLTSVAFDTDGEPIPDYIQTGQPYLDYSPVVPRIAHRAAGKLFLGSYSFDAATCTETYREGIAWSSRPRSLNGYYRFLPVDANRSASGLAKVEVLGEVDGEERVIASARAMLPIASTYTAFSVPLTYDCFGIKATSIRVMFASSAQIGTIDEETAHIVTVPDAPSAISAGGRLWIDNVTLAY